MDDHFVSESPQNPPNDSASDLTSTPQRLLYVPTMTSVTWETAMQNCNGTRPVYNILSYTWGRFSTEGAALKVDGTTWQIPAIKTSHFSVPEFENVLRSVASSSNYVWVDIACIDQVNQRTKMNEIGKQADIFRGAHEAFIWLTRLDETVLREFDTTLTQFEKSLMATKMDRASFLRDHNQIRDVLKEGIEKVLDAAQALLSDPWFSSLWALQEANLREDAFILPRSGLPVAINLGHGRSVPLRLRSIAGSFQDIMLSLISVQDLSDDVRSFLSLIERSGLLTIGAETDGMPLHIYPAAHYRSTQREHDRVYAIMQVYHLRLGTAQFPDQTFTLQDLELQLATALNATSPIAAQLFVHRNVPKPGQAWKITKDCTLPTIYYIAETGLHKRCTIIPHRNQHGVVFTGRYASLQSLMNFWIASMHQRERQRTEKGWSQYEKTMFTHYQANIDLDAGHATEAAGLSFLRLANEPTSVCGCVWCLEHYQAKDICGLSKLASKLPYPASQYSVLLLGHTTLYQFRDDITQSGLIVSALLGILGIFETANSAPAFRRIGLCSWEAGQEELREQHETFWHAGNFELL
ncbi:hypothetical protein H2198_007200 [Neophaeococcomyces mojaviensis]|uniref:Uncharacterized protein n=1 Tax=Neophaeococcomyces mojaviensis TaxID=3383035 RepID=A0ACC3A175_9EURO|nr:hypothetical protein H2198_007200 [Knufia sp. JES_112]